MPRELPLSQLPRKSNQDIFSLPFPKTFPQTGIILTNHTKRGLLHIGIDHWNDKFIQNDGIKHLLILRNPTLKEQYKALEGTHETAISVFLRKQFPALFPKLQLDIHDFLKTTLQTAEYCGFGRGRGNRLLLYWKIKDEKVAQLYLSTCFIADVMYSPDKEKDPNVASPRKMFELLAAYFISKEDYDFYLEEGAIHEWIPGFH